MYVDENGNLSSSPPGVKKATENKPERPAAGPVQMRHTGILERFNESKGYGFIKDQLTRKTVFVHVHNVDGTLQVNDMVEFEVQESPKGAAAVKVRKISV